LREDVVIDFRKKLIFNSSDSQVRQRGDKKKQKKRKVVSFTAKTESRTFSFFSHHASEFIISSRSAFTLVIAFSRALLKVAL